MGEKLLEASRHYQVFCSTHLQQIAALGNPHLLVTEEAVGARNLIKVANLSGAAGTAEIGRMLAGSHAGEAAFKQAEKMVVGQ